MTFLYLGPMHNFTWFQHIKSKLRFTAAVLAALVLATACSSASDSGADTESSISEPAATETDTTDAPTTEATEAPVAAEEPAAAEDETAASGGAGESAAVASADTPAGQTLDWVMADLLNNPSPDIDEVAARFSPQFLQVVPVEQIVGLLPQMQRAGQWSIVESDVSDFTATAVLVATDGSELDASLNVSAGDPALIEGLLFTPRFETATVETVEDYEAALDGVATQNAVGIFEIIDGECSTVIDLGAEDIMPIGSVFKLWVLAELAHQIDVGAMSWDDTIAVQDRYKSSPDGTIYQMAEGREISLFEFAAEMISISDNTATDHLLFHLGRANVEGAMVRSGIAQPERNIPMLATADLFRLKFDPTPPNSSDYRALDTDGRRALIESMEDTTPSWVGQETVEVPVNADGVTADLPRDHDIEWFATPLDLCRTHLHLAELAETPGLEQVADILRMNADAGLPFDQETWTDLRFKGGSEQGLIAAAWRMERNDGRSFVLAGGVEDPDAPINPAAAISILAQGAELAAAIN